MTGEGVGDMPADYRAKLVGIDPDRIRAEVLGTWTHDDGAPDGARGVAGGVHGSAAQGTPVTSVTIGGVTSAGDPGPHVARITHGDGTTVDLPLPPGPQGYDGARTPDHIVTRLTAEQSAAWEQWRGEYPDDDAAGWVPWAVVWVLALVGAVVSLVVLS